MGWFRRCSALTPVCETEGARKCRSKESGWSSSAGVRASRAVSPRTRMRRARESSRIGVPGIRAAFADFGEESSLKALADEVGELDYLVTLAAAPANGPVSALSRDAVVRAFDAKVIGPLLLARQFAPRFRDGG